MAQWQGEIESENMGGKWSAERIYHFILVFLLLLFLPIAFFRPYFG